MLLKILSKIHEFEKNQCPLSKCWSTVCRWFGGVTFFLFHSLLRVVNPRGFTCFLLSLLLARSPALEAKEANEVTDRFKLSESLNRKFSSISSPIEAISAWFESILELFCVLSHNFVIIIKKALVVRSCVSYLNQPSSRQNWSSLPYFEVYSTYSELIQRRACALLRTVSLQRSGFAHRYNPVLFIQKLKTDRKICITPYV